LTVVGSLLLRGMLVGIVAGLLTFGFALVFGEPPLESAISFEQHAAHAAGGAHQHGAGQAHQHEEELVSRATQAGIGLLTGVVVYGAAVGGLFALVFAFVYGRVSPLGPRATAALLALAAFLAIVLVPALKYPANPPSVGHPETIGYRTALFFIMVAISVAALVAAVMLGRRLAARMNGWNAALLGGAAFVTIIAIAQYALPEFNEVPEHFSAVVLWRFRVASIGLQVVLWTTLGLLFGAVVDRSSGGPAGKITPA
jgi:predicted cobalt transporter CbtA